MFWLKKQLSSILLHRPKYLLSIYFFSYFSRYLWLAERKTESGEVDNNNNKKNPTNNTNDYIRVMHYEEK